MTDERQYKESEVREIFDLAANTAGVGGLPAVTDERGLTLSQLQDVGLEAGMEPARIAEAAYAIDTRQGVAPRGTHMGAPTSVGRIVALPRAATDREWDILVGELRETFGARGVVTTHGRVREWSNGNLHAFLEPTATGHRLRMGTVKGNAAPILRAGLTGTIVGPLLLVLFIIVEGIAPAAAFATLITLVSGGTLGASFMRLPRWASEREAQMEHIAGRARGLIGQPDEIESVG